MATDPLQDALKHLQKGMPDAFEYDDNCRAISTGCLAIDAITGIGGFPIGRVSEVSGWEFSGKTMLCLTACGAAQAAGLYPVYIDVEHGVDLALAERLGFDHKDRARGLYVTPDTFEQSLIVIARLVETGKVHVIFVDSVPAMVPQAEIEGKIEDTGQMAARARLLAYALPKLVKMISKEPQVALVFVNQMRSNIETDVYKARFADRERTAGGAALKFYSSMRLKLRQVRKGSTTRTETDPFTGKEVEVPIASQHECEIFKNRVAVPYRKATFYVRFDAASNNFGIDNLQTVLDLAVTGGLVVKKGSYFNYTGPQYNFSTQGIESAYTHLHDHPEITAEIRATLGI